MKIAIGFGGVRFAHEITIVSLVGMKEAKRFIMPSQNHTINIILNFENGIYIQYIKF